MLEPKCHTKTIWPLAPMTLPKQRPETEGDNGIINYNSPQATETTGDNRRQRETTGGKERQRASGHWLRRQRETAGVSNYVGN